MKNFLSMISQHQHTFLVKGYSSIDNVKQVERVIQKDSKIPLSLFKNLNTLLDELRSGKEKNIPFSHIEKAIRFDGFNPELFLNLHTKFLKFQDLGYNLVVDVGLDDILSKYYKGSNYTAIHYCGLVSATPTIIAGNTMAVHAGWTEVVAYDELVRQTVTWGSVSGQSVNNSASKAVFTISTNDTDIGGGFVTTDNVKSATDGILVGAAAFTAGNKSLDDNDTLSVTVTATSAAT